VAYGLGIPFRYRSSEPGIRMMTIVPVMVPLKKPDSDEEEHPMKKVFAKTLPLVAVFSRGIADVVFSVSEPRHSFFPELGMTCKKINGDIQITAVKKKGLAETAGLKKGDVVSAADGIRLETLEQLRRILAEKTWGDLIELRLGRKIKLEKGENRLP
jgi:membrane-associated protease RseP (regulator of RpoE activity)